MITPDTRLSEHLTWGEAIHTRHTEFMAEQQNPPPEVRANLRRAALDAFEPVRALWRCPVLVNSGYRCPELNKKIGGSKTSMHMQGLAFDIVPLGIDLHDGWRRLMYSSIVLDQAIWEYGTWIHIGLAPHGLQPRQQKLAYYVRGERSVVWKPEDPRFLRVV